MRQLWQPSAVGPRERDCLQLGSQREELGLVLHCSEVVVYIAHRVFLLDHYIIVSVSACHSADICMDTIMGHRQWLIDRKYMYMLHCFNC